MPTHTPSVVSRLRSLAVVAFGALLLAAGGAASCGGSSGPTPIAEADWCNQASVALCKKVYACPTELATAQTLLLLAGVTSEVTCEAYAQKNCSTLGLMCTAGQTYHGDAAAECKSKVETMTCAQIAANFNIMDPTAAVPVCGQICTSANGDAAAGN